MAAIFTLHKRLAKGAFVVGDLTLCRVLLKDDARWPWLLLVPRVAGVEEVHTLTDDDAAQLIREIRAASRAVAALNGVAKVNVGALGNQVRQLHVHVIGRHEGDAAWPGPVWGVEGKVGYTPAAREDMMAGLRAPDSWAGLGFDVNPL
jgi:diadenosine tetraphosphate (Ap4A) HIT family hydrolase